MGKREPVKIAKTAIVDRNAMYVFLCLLLTNSILPCKLEA